MREEQPGPGFVPRRPRRAGRAGVPSARTAGDQAPGGVPEQDDVLSPGAGGTDGSPGTGGADGTGAAVDVPGAGQADGAGTADGGTDGTDDTAGTDGMAGTDGTPRRGRRLRTGLKWQLSGAIAAVGALIAVALSLVVHNSARASMLDGARDVQIERLQFAQRIYEASGRLQFGTVMDDPHLPRTLRQKTAAGRRATYISPDSAHGGPPDVWAAVPMKDGHVLSLHTTIADGSAAVIHDLDQSLVIGSIAVVAGGSAVGVLIGGPMSRRLRRAAAAAGEVARGRSDVRVCDALGGVVHNETDDLAQAVDAMADTLRQRLEAERRVTADIAHELRTPVTGLLTAAELLPPGRPSELVKDRAQALRTLVEDVLEVARLDSAAERAELQDILLGEFVARRVTEFGQDVRVRVVHESEVTTDPRRLERIVGNLLANAAKHGRPPVEVTVEGRVVRVRDHGPGFPQALLEEGPSRFRTGSEDRAGHGHGGHGLGLTIAAGQARVLGARLTFRNVVAPNAPWGAPPEGALAVLWLPGHAPTSNGCYARPNLPGEREES